MTNPCCRSAVTAAIGAVLATFGAVVVIIEDELNRDLRSYRCPRSRRFSKRQSLFSTADLNSAFDNGWFRVTFRCNKTSFDIINEMVEEKCLSAHHEIAHNAVFSIRDRVSVTIFYLTHPGSLKNAVQVFGMSKTSAIQFIREICDILVDRLAADTMKMPMGRNHPDWNILSQGFEAICGFPNCCLAIDGTIIKIELPSDFFG